MKKTIIWSLLVALTLTLILFGIDTYGALKNEDMLICYESAGGDCSVDQGIGWSILHLYPLTSVSDTSPTTTIKVSFDFLSIVMVFLGLFLVSFFVGNIICKKFKQVIIGVGGLAVIVLLWYFVPLIKGAIGETPTELTSIRVYTSDMKSGNCYMVSYPYRVYYFAAAGTDGEKGHSKMESLNLQDHVGDISKEQLEKILDAAENVKKEAIRGDNKKDFAFRIDIRYKTRDGNGKLDFYGCESYPDTWKDFAHLVNEICGDDYLDETPEMIKFTKHWFIENFGISEEDMPDEGDIDGFIKNREINMKTIAGIYYNGDEHQFNVEDELKAYAKAFTRANTEYLEEIRAKEVISVASTQADFRNFAYSFAEKLGKKDDVNYYLSPDGETEYVSFSYEYDKIYVFRSEKINVVLDDSGKPVSDNLGYDGNLPLYYDTTGKYVMATKSAEAKVYETFFEMKNEAINEREDNEMKAENDEKRATLESLKTEAPLDMYSMTYYNRFYFDEYLQDGYKGTEAWIAFITEKIVGNMEEYAEIKKNNCSAFICRNENDEILYCRNFDIAEISPCCMLTTVGKDGYRSIGGTDISILYNPATNAMELETPNNLAALALPYRTHDGMNEYGVAASILMAGRGKTINDGSKKMLSVLDVIRIVLEKAKNVDEAIEVLSQYNVDLGPVYDCTPFHYFIADATGRAVVVEYGEGELTVVESNYVTNFNLDGAHNGVGQDRYEIIEKTLNEHNNVLSEQEAMDLLASVVMKGLERYSVIYNLTTGDVIAFSHADPSVSASFKLEMNH